MFKLCGALEIFQPHVVSQSRNRERLLYWPNCQATPLDMTCPGSATVPALSLVKFPARENAVPQTVTLSFETTRVCVWTLVPVQPTWLVDTEIYLPLKKRFIRQYAGKSKRKSLGKPSVLEE